MVRRRAIGASLAAAFVFSTLLLSNFALLASADQRERLSVVVNSESDLGDTAVVLAGSQSLGILLSLQDMLASKPHQCPTVLEQVKRFVGTVDLSGTQDGISVEESAVVVGGAVLPDNFSIIWPFNGSFPGGINLDVKVAWTGTSPLGDVSYHKTEVHRENLPVLLNLTASFCEASAAEIRSLLEGNPFPTCDASTIGLPIVALGEALRSRAAAEDLEFTVSYQVISSPGCYVDFTLRVTQNGVLGPGGAFTVGLEEETVVTVRIGG